MPIELSHKALAHYITIYCRDAKRTDLNQAETIAAALDALDAIDTVPVVDAMNYELALGDTLASIALYHTPSTGGHIPLEGS